MNGQNGRAPSLSAFQITYATVLMVLRNALRCNLNVVTGEFIERNVSMSWFDDPDLAVDPTWTRAIVRDLVNRDLLTVLRSQHRSGFVGLMSTSLDDVVFEKAKFHISPAVLHAKTAPQSEPSVNNINFNYGEQFFGNASKFVEIHAQPIAATQEPETPKPPEQNPEDWTEWTQTKVARQWFPSITSDAGWTDFANAFRAEGLIINHPTSKARVLRIHKTVFVRHGLKFPPPGC